MSEGVWSDGRKVERKEGRREGLQEGWLEERQDTAKKMLLRDYHWKQSGILLTFLLRN
jgi:hypothetical protein